jgi:hypothetical protein
MGTDTYLHQLAARALNITYDSSGDINWVDPTDGKLFVYNAGDIAWVRRPFSLPLSLSSPPSPRPSPVLPAPPQCSEKTALTPRHRSSHPWPSSGS